MTPPTIDPRPTVVLDTNAVLDWLLFRDPGIARLGDALQHEKLRWVSCPRMRTEFCRTLLRPELERWNPQRQRLLAMFDRRAQLLPDPPPAPLRLRCTDTSDQVFVDLALACSARWLLSHDKALLRLCRRMAPAGTLICKPSDWREARAPSA